MYHQKLFRYWVTIEHCPRQRADCAILGSFRADMEKKPKSVNSVFKIEFDSVNANDIALLV